MTHTDKNVNHLPTQGATNLYLHLTKLLPELAKFEKDKIPPLSNL